MIERMDVGTRMSKIVKHNGVAYLCGQVGNPGETVAEQTKEGEVAPEVAQAFDK